jgi:broad specificity phosphatase PhoE
MKTKVLLIRHGETAWNKNLRFQGHTDIPLCEEGIEQAKLASKKINGNFDIVYASPLNRAYTTASILCEHTPIAPIIYNDLKEINFGPWEGHTLDQIKELYPNDYNNWSNDPVDGFFTGGDKSLKEVSTRCKDAILDIVSNNKGKTILIVAHGGILRAGLIGLFGWDMTMYHKFFLGNTSVTTLTFNDENKPFLINLNDTSHLNL